jgi:hypothetical protein
VRVRRILATWERRNIHLSVAWRRRAVPPSAPGLRSRRQRRPGESERPTDNAEEHSYEKSTEVRNDERAERSKHRDNRVEHALSWVEPEQQGAHGHHYRDHIPGEPLRAEMHDDGYRCALSEEDLSGGE